MRKFPHPPPAPVAAGSFGDSRSACGAHRNAGSKPRFGSDATPWPSIRTWSINLASPANRYNSVKRCRSLRQTGWRSFSRFGFLPDEEAQVGDYGEGALTLHKRTLSPAAPVQS
ncbi:MAG: hypothetical protein IPG34_15625 [Rhodocyclaceae bacterium]|nr:hypothetical protein [Rhodocyclaceae bacterium]